MKVRALVCSLTLAAVTISAMGAQLELPSASPPPSPPPLQPTPSEIEIYKAAHTLIDWTPEEISDCPFLHEARPAANQDQLPGILARVGQTVTMLFRDFPQIACDEKITFRSSLRPSPSHGKYRYIVLPRPIGDAPAFEEYRTDYLGNPFSTWSLEGDFIITYDFASTCLYLSPADQRNSRFRYFGDETIRERECHVVGFAQDPERAHRFGYFNSEGKTIVILLQGVAWIDAETFGSRPGCSPLGGAWASVP
jgi:hypothetical protein